MSTSSGNLIPVAFILQISLGTIMGAVGLVSGFVLGSYIGGNFGFFRFAGSVGYEAGGIFFAYILMPIGVFLGVLAGSALLRFPVAKKAAFLGASFLGFLCLTVMQMAAGTYWIYVFVFLSALFSAIGAQMSWIMVKRG